MRNPSAQSSNSGFQPRNGTPTSDNVTGTQQHDLLNGFAGNDTIDGGDGNDLLVGGEDDDQLLGANGDDDLLGDIGNDLLRGGLGEDILQGGEGADELHGGQGEDFLQGNQGNDTVIGGAGADVVRGGKDDDLVMGGEGNDTLYAGLGNNTLNGGGGIDTFILVSKDGAVDTIITDFNHDNANEKIELRNFDLDDFDDLIVGNTANGALVHLPGGQTILLGGVDASDVRASLFTVDGRFLSDTTSGGGGGGGGGPTNNAPTVANALIDQGATEDSTFAYQFASNSFADSDVGDTLAYTAALSGGGALPAWLTFDDTTRTFSGTPANGDVGSVTVRVTADDGNGGMVTDDFTIITANMNDAPVNTVPAAQTTNEDTAKVISGVGISDVDNASFTVTLNVTHGILSLNAGVVGGLAAGGIVGDGTDTVILTGTSAAVNATLADAAGLTYIPTANYNGADTLTITSSDGTDTDVDTVGITVSAVNDAPTIAAVTKNGTEDVSMNFTAANFTGVYSDVEATALNKIKITSLASHGAIYLSGVAVTLNQEIAAADLANITYTGDGNYNGADSFTWQASDGTDYSSAANVDITLAAVDDSVAFSSTTVATATVGTLYSYSITVADVDGPTGAITAVSKPAWLTLTDNGDNTATLTGTPAAGNRGLVSITLQAANGTTATQTYDLFVGDAGLSGTSSNDTVTGTGGADYMGGGDGNDSLDAGAGNDSMSGGNGNDTLYGGAGYDTLSGGNGDDDFMFYAATGNLDSIDGGGGTDRLVAGQNSAVIEISSFANIEEVTANGFTGVWMSGDGVNNNWNFTGVTLTNVTIYGGSGYDTLTGNAQDNDFIYMGATASLDAVNGAGGNDRLLGGQNNAYIEVNTFSNIEEINANGYTGVRVSGDGNANNWDFTGITVSNVLIWGGSFNDTIVGTASADSIDGGSNNDTITGGDGVDTLTGGINNDTHKFLALSNSGVGAGNRDIITDFSHTIDKIDISAFAGTATFRAGGGGTGDFTGSTFQVAYQQTGGNTIVFVDTDGNNATDFEIQLTGTIGLTSGDFLL